MKTLNITVSSCGTCPYCDVHLTEYGAIEAWCSETDLVVEDYKSLDKFCPLPEVASA